MVCWSRDFVCLLLFPSFVKFKFLVIFSGCKCSCCFSDAVTKANERLRNASAVTSEIDRWVEMLEAVADDGELQYQ